MRKLLFTTTILSILLSSCGNVEPRNASMGCVYKNANNEVVTELLAGNTYFMNVGVSVDTTNINKYSFTARVPANDNLVIEYFSGPAVTISINGNFLDLTYSGEEKETSINTFIYKINALSTGTVSFSIISEENIHFQENTFNITVI